MNLYSVRSFKINHLKDPWTKPKGGRIEGGKWGWVGWGRVVGGKWRQPYLKNNKKMNTEKRIGLFI